MDGPIYTTPGTRLFWSSVESWIRTAHRISNRRLSEARNDALRAHAGALPQSLINAECDPEVLDRALHILKYGPAGLSRPTRGHRAGHPSTLTIMHLKNRQATLNRQADADSIPEGANWNIAHGGHDETA